MEFPLAEPLNLTQLATISYQFVTSLLQHLTQSDIEALLVAVPSLNDLFERFPKSDFPLIQQLVFLHSTSNPICVRGLYDNVRVDTNLPSSHPVSQAILKNGEYLRSISFGLVDIDALKGTLVEELLKSSLVLSTFTIETMTLNPYRLFRRASQLIPSKSLSVQDFNINSFSRLVRNRHYFAQCWALSSLLNSFNKIGSCQVPNQLLGVPEPMMLLMNDVNNVVRFSLQNSTMTADNLRQVLRYDVPLGIKFTRVPFIVTGTLGFHEFERLFGSVVQSMVGVELMIGAPLDPKEQLILRRSSKLQINIEYPHFVIDASVLQLDIRSIVFTSPENTFPVDGLMRFTPLFNSIQSIFESFGQMDVLDIRSCLLPREYGVTAVENLYGAWVGRIVK